MQKRTKVYWFQVKTGKILLNLDKNWKAFDNFRQKRSEFSHLKVQVLPLNVQRSLQSFHDVRERPLPHIDIFGKRLDKPSTLHRGQLRHVLLERLEAIVHGFNPAVGKRLNIKNSAECLFCHAPEETFVRGHFDCDVLPRFGDGLQPVLDLQLHRRRVRDLVNLLRVVHHLHADDRLQVERGSVLVKLFEHRRLDPVPVPGAHRRVLQIIDEWQRPPERVHPGPGEIHNRPTAAIALTFAGLKLI